MIDHPPPTLPKAELHLHIEGTLEPELDVEGRRNGVRLPYPNAEAKPGAPGFNTSQSFLDVVDYRACSVLIHERDFYELTTAYLALRTSSGRSSRRDLLLFDRHNDTAVVSSSKPSWRGIGWALTQARKRGMTSHLIMCFLRDLTVDDAMATLEQALAHRDMIFGVGLDPGLPSPEILRDVFDRAISAGFRAVADGGEGLPVSGKRWMLGAERIDHGVRRPAGSVARSSASRPIGCAVCPFSTSSCGCADA